MTDTITPPTDTVVADVCDKAADHVDQVGLHQGYLYDQQQADDGTPVAKCRVCMVGAINVAVHGAPRYARTEGLELVAWHTEQAVKRFLRTACVAAWTDGAGRTKDNVVQALRDTATSLRGEAS